MNRREPWLWAAACVAGAALVLVAAGRTWATVGFARRAADAGGIPVTGSDVVPFLTPVALAALAAVAAVAAVRGLPRRLIGAVLALAGAAVAAGAWSGSRDAALLEAAARRASAVARAVGAGFAAPAVTWVWPVLTGLAGAVLLAGGAVAVIRADRWPGMSRRYDHRGSHPVRSARAGSRAGDDAALWDALDRGVDPTADEY